MRIACLQFAPQVGETDENIERADAILEQADPQDIDLLVLPELAFSGYNFKSLRQISPHLELGETGISAAWSRQAALKYDCVVVTGYPEKVDAVDSWPADPEYYNSALIMNGDGDVVGNYRKSHLYYTDETWALEGGRGFYTGCVQGLGHMAVGICMDINPHKFEAPWEAYEFSSHVLETGARLVVLSMAWCTHADQHEFFLNPAEPDMDTLLYWIARLQPIISLDSSQETIIVFGNRCGVEGDTTYVGTSTVLGIKSGEILLYGILGRDEESLLVVDTDALPYAKLKLKSHEPIPAQDQGEDIQAPQVHQGGSPSDERNHESDPEKCTAHGMETNQALSSDAQGHTLDTVTNGAQRESYNQLEPWRRPHVYPTSGPFRFDGIGLEITSSESHAGHNQFTQSHVAGPVTQKHDPEDLRQTLSDGDIDSGHANDFFDSDADSLLSYPFSQSDEGAQESRMHGGELQHGAVSTHLEHRQIAGRRHPSAHCPQARPPNQQPEHDGSLENCLVQMVSAFAFEDEALMSSNVETFKEEDMYKFVHGKNLTSEHHIRYHTHLLREKRAKQGLPADTKDDDEDQQIYREEEEADVVFAEQLELNEASHNSWCVGVEQANRTEQPSAALASLNLVRTGLDAQPNRAYGNRTGVRQTFWLEHSAEPTPIADTPMSYMTQFSPRQVRTANKSRAPVFSTAASVQTTCQPQARHAEELSSGTKTGDARVGEIRIAIDSELASADGIEYATYSDSMPALSWLSAKENSVSLQDPSRRPKAAARQVSPLRLVPRQAPKEKEREVRERSWRTSRYASIGRETERPKPRDQGHDKGHKTHVPMVLVYEGEEIGVDLTNRYY